MNSSLPGKEIIAYGCPFYEAMGERLHRPSTLTQAFLIIITVVHILTFPLTAALNALVMFAVKMNSRLRAHKSNIGLALLALTDFFVGVLAQPAFIALIITLLVDDSSRSCTLPNFTFAVSRIGVSVSLVHTVLISGERYLAVRHSFACETQSCWRKVEESCNRIWLRIVQISESATFLFLFFFRAKQSPPSNRDSLRNAFCR